MRAGLTLALTLPLAFCSGPSTPPYELASETSTPVPCTDEVTRERIRGIMFDALDEALKNHITRLFEVWLKDDTGQPARASTGTRAGITAYLHARKQAETWSPMICAG